MDRFIHIKKITFNYAKNHIKLWYFYGLVLVCCILSGCNKNQNEIDEQCRSGVVLIINQWYYTIDIPGLQTFYFSADNNKVHHVEFDPELVGNCVMAATGTGFFISEDGKIATNRHVASSTVDEHVLKLATNEIINEIITIIENNNKELEKLINQNKFEYAKSTNRDDKIRLIQMNDEIENEKNKNNEIIRSLNRTHAEYADIKYISDLYVALNMTFVNSYEDLYKCTLLGVMEEREKDLAIIQMNSKETPSRAYIFDVPAKDMLKHYSFGEFLSKNMGSDKNEELYMIGFNLGFDLAQTSEGIYSQCTKGAVSQNVGGVEHIQYSVPAEHGSSGSPVLNRRGQLVAINYAGVPDTPNFNFGVKEKYLYELIQRLKSR